MMRQKIKKWLRQLGYDVVKLNPFSPASPNKPPYANFTSIFDDLIQRGFTTKAIFDIGANDGSWSRMAKKSFPSADFFMVEPQLEMEPSLKKMNEEFAGTTYFLGGAGNEDSQLTLTVWGDKAGSSFIPTITEIFDYATEKRIVPVKTINTLIQLYQLKIPNLVKLDIQGFEIEALKGATSLFGKTEIFILEVALFKFEGMPIFHEVIAFMQHHGYLIYDFAGFSRRPYDGALGQCDIVFVYKSSKLIQHQNWR